MCVPEQEGKALKGGGGWGSLQACMHSVSEVNTSRKLCTNVRLPACVSTELCASPGLPKLLAAQNPAPFSNHPPFHNPSPQVTEGSGRMLVLAVGEQSDWGRTMSMVQVESPDTPLQVLAVGCWS